MKSVMSAAACGFCLALMGWGAQAQEPTANAAPMSLLGSAPQHTGTGTVIPYKAQAALPVNASPSRQGFGETSTLSQSATMPSDTPPAGMRVSYKRAANGSFVKTYVRETGTN